MKTQLLTVTFALVVGCGVRSPPLPPTPQDTRPAAGDPLMVPTGNAGQMPPAAQNLDHSASFPDGGPPWLLKQQVPDAGVTVPVPTP